MVAGVIAMEIGGRVAAKIQELGANVQTSVRGEFGDRTLLSSFIIGLTMGLVWAPCAGPALGFVLVLVQREPGFTALLYLIAYAAGAAIPLLLIGYGGQYAVRSARAVSHHSGFIKQVAGVFLILTAIALSFNASQKLQVWFAENTGFGSFADSLEKSLFGYGADEMRAPTGDRLPVLGSAPEEFVRPGQWFNSTPVKLSDLRGKVVLIDFWTYSCINCIRTLPYIEAYWNNYKDQPFVLIGVHTPEFVFEKSPKNVQMAIDEHGLTYPVVQDNDFGTWEAFDNHYWPAKYLIDAQGNIRYRHFGEGSYEETAQAIESLLAEIGADTGSGITLPAETPAYGKPVTRETYLGPRSWNALGNAKGAPSDDSVTYRVPTELTLHSYYLGGTWQVADDERQVLHSDEGEIRIRAQGGEVNLVLGLEDGAAPVKADVIVDGKQFKSFIIDRHDLYNLYKGEYGEHDVSLKIHGKGVAGYAYTFGS